MFSRRSIFLTALSCAVALAGRAQIFNVSYRTQLQAGYTETFLDFVVPEGDPMTILLRGAGPTLSNFGIVNALVDPAIELFSNNTLIASNDNWDASLAPIFSSVGAFSFLNGSKDAALVATLAPGSYSSRLFSTDNGTGDVMHEFYVLNPLQSVGQVAVESRASFATNTIVGFTTRTTDNFLLRAVGPGLGEPGSSTNPNLDLYSSGAAKIGSNDNWTDAATQAFALQAGLSPLAPGSLDSALLKTLEGPGSYIAFVSGTPGNVRLEIVSESSLPELTPVPEPATWGAIGAGMLLLTVAWKRRMAGTRKTEG